jgi:hypothetical protein
VQLSAYDEAYAAAENADRAYPLTWPGMIQRVAQLTKGIDLANEEVNYKLQLAGKLATARDKLLKGEDPWLESLSAALRNRQNNLINYRVTDRLLSWLRDNRKKGALVLRALWASSGDSPTSRLRAFLEALPGDAVAGPGARLDVASTLLMAISAADCPPIRQTAFSEAFRLTGVRPIATKPESAFYERSLAYLDELIRLARETGIDGITNRLDAQGAIWHVSHKSEMLRAPSAAPSSIASAQATSPSILRRDVAAFYDGKEKNWALYFDERLVSSGLARRELLRRVVRELIARGESPDTLKSIAHAPNMFFDLPESASAKEIEAEARRLRPDDPRAMSRFDCKPEHSIRHGERVYILFNNNSPAKLAALAGFASSKGVTWIRGPGRPEAVNPSTYSIDDLAAEAFVARRELARMLAGLERRRNIVLQGPPGVGKSFLAKRLAFALIGTRAEDNVQVIQFHQSYAYEDFIQGWRPTATGGFSLRNGVFHQFCAKARTRPQELFVFVIDEINRGNLSKIFGELMLLIEADKRGPEFAVQLTYDESTAAFFVPENVYIIGLMNTADRSLALVDYALRRRFAFISLAPGFATPGFAALLRAHGIGEDMVSRIVMGIPAINEGIEADTKNLGPGFMIGHSFFCPRGRVDDAELWYQSIIRDEIQPLLEEYWFDDAARVSTCVEKLLQ